MSPAVKVTSGGSGSAALLSPVKFNETAAAITSAINVAKAGSIRSFDYAATAAQIVIVVATVTVIALARARIRKTPV